MRGPRVEWNPDAEAISKVIKGDSEKPVWLTRVRYRGSEGEWAEGLVMEMGGWVKRTNDPVKLGYDVKHADFYLYRDRKR